MFEPPYRIKNMVPGMIMLWNGTIATIPSGWHLCDGTMGTPDLRDQFIICASEDDAGVAKAQITGSAKQSGGAANHWHGFTGNGHSHTLAAGTDLGAGTGYSNETETDPAVGTTGGSYHYPPCYALCYIQKL